MSVSGLGSSGASSLAALMNQRRQSLQTMASDIQSGDLSGAQQALTSLQAGSNGSASSANSGNPYKSTLSTDLSSISSALQSGDTSQAQSALTTFQTDLQASKQGTGGVHHGHHHGGGGGAASSTDSNDLFDSSQLDALTTATQTASGLGTSADNSTNDILSQLLSSLDNSAS